MHAYRRSELFPGLLRRNLACGSLGASTSTLHMEIRESITVPGVPFTWNTNLSDDDVRDFYEQHGVNAPWEESDISVFTLMTTLRIIMTVVPFRDGTCQWHAVNERHWVVFRTNYEWEIWEARKRELDELDEEQAHERAAEYLLFRTDDAHLLRVACEALEGEDFAAAARCYSARAEVRRTFHHLPNVESSLYFVVEDSLMRFTSFPDATYGLAFLQKYSTCSCQYHEFAGHFHFWRPDWTLAQRHVEEERIYDTAIARFPSDGQLYKDACLFWRREKRLDLAIKYCRAAVASDASDDTKTGFPGRLKRLTSEYERSARI